MLNATTATISGSPGIGRQLPYADLRNVAAARKTCSGGWRVCPSFTSVVTWGTGLQTLIS